MLPILVALFPQGRGFSRNTGIVDKYVDAATLFENLPDRGLDRRRTRNVDFKGESIASDRTRDLAGAFDIQVGNHNYGARLRQPSRDRLTDARSCSGNDRRLAGQFESHRRCQSSLTTWTVISVVTSRCSRTGTVNVPNCLMGSSSWILRRSMVKFCFSSASTMSLVVTEPKSCSFSPAFCTIVMFTPLRIFERSSASPLSLVSRRKCACRSCSTIFLLPSVAATASLFGNRKLRA